MEEGVEIRGLKLSDPTPITAQGKAGRERKGGWRSQAMWPRVWYSCPLNESPIEIPGIKAQWSLWIGEHMRWGPGIPGGLHTLRAPGLALHLFPLALRCVLYNKTI